MIEPRHTLALRYRWWERLHFWLFGHWPASVVDRRLFALSQDESEAELELLRRRA